VEDIIHRRIRIRLFLIIFYGWFMLVSVCGQINRGGSPVTEKLTYPADAIVLMAPVDLEQIREINSYRPDKKDEPFQFAIPSGVSLNPENSGRWYTLSDGTRIWKLGIHSSGAFSINLIFDQFELTPGARLYIYDANREYVLGAFTSENNKESGILAVQPVPGDLIFIEYHPSKTLVQSSKLSIGQVNHDFVDIFHLDKTKDGQFGQSGPCNIDINCPEGENWQAQKRSVTRILINGIELCTGVLVNNTSLDGRPYLLTAGHCISDGSDAQSTVTVFNYESPYCDGPDGMVNQTISGASLKATISNLDFTLVELSAYPPIYYQPYYAGWDASGNGPASSVSIHHPKGDVKKISKDYDAAVSSDYVPYDANTFWKILMWDLGTTEPASSGAPLFNENGLLVGTLSGGEASCGNSVNDYYQKFSESYDRYSSANQQLKYWLDPLNLGNGSLSGWDPYGPDEVSCDTLSNIMATENLVLKEFTDGDPADGWWTGHNVERVTRYAEKLALQVGDKLVGATYLISDVKFNASTDSVWFHVWEGVNQPGTILLRKAYPLNYFKDSTAFDISFDTVIQVNTPLWIGYEIKYDFPVSGALPDQFSVFQVEPRGPSGTNTAYLYENGNWIGFDTNPWFPMITSLGIQARLCSDIPNLSILDSSYSVEPVFFNIYPNPTQGRFRIDFAEPYFEEVRLRVLTLMGVTLIDHRYRHVDGELLMESLSLNTGLYIIRVDVNERFLSKQLLIIK